MIKIVKVFPILKKFGGYNQLGKKNRRMNQQSNLIQPRDNHMWGWSTTQKYWLEVTPTRHTHKHELFIVTVGMTETIFELGNPG